VYWACRRLQQAGKWGNGEDCGGAQVWLSAQIIETERGGIEPRPGFVCGPVDDGLAERQRKSLRCAGVD